MPFYLRRIEPVMVGRRSSTTTSATMNETETTANLILCNLIRQLGSLGVIAMDIFDGVSKECRLLHHRSQTLRHRIHHLNHLLLNKSSKLSVMGSASFEQSAMRSLTESNFESKDEDEDEIATVHVWSSKAELESCFFTPQSRPQALSKLYEQCEQVPELQALQHLREDGKQCSKMYSDPSMFFESWRQAMLEAAVEQRELRRRQRKKKTRPQRKQIKVAKIVTFADKVREREARAGNLTLPRKKRSFDAENEESNMDNTDNDDHNKEKETIEEEIDLEKPLTRQLTWELDDHLDLLPPPPDDLLADDVVVDTYHQDEDQKMVNVAELPPPPPLPPPPTLSRPKSPPLKPMRSNTIEKKGMEQKKHSQGDRSDLLRQIREGKELRKVQRRSSLAKATEASGGMNNVASILALVMEQRYAAMHDDAIVVEEEDDDDDPWDQQS